MNANWPRSGPAREASAPSPPIFRARWSTSAAWDLATDPTTSAASGSHPCIRLPAPCRIFIVTVCPYAVGEATLYLGPPRVTAGGVSLLEGYDPAAGPRRIVLADPVSVVALNSAAVHAGETLELVAVYGLDASTDVPGSSGGGGGGGAVDVTAFQGSAAPASLASLPTLRVNVNGRPGGVVAAADWDVAPLAGIAGATQLLLAGSAARGATFVSTQTPGSNYLRRTNVAAIAGIILPYYVSPPVLVPGGSDWYVYSGVAGLIYASGVSES